MFFETAGARAENNAAMGENQRALLFSWSSTASSFFFSFMSLPIWLLMALNSMASVSAFCVAAGKDGLVVGFMFFLVLGWTKK